MYSSSITLSFIILSSLYLFRVPGKLYEFVKDLHSGKLHKDFHNPPPVSLCTHFTDARMCGRGVGMGFPKP
jgi:hypothetical protein